MALAEVVGIDEFREVQTARDLQHEIIEALQDLGLNKEAEKFEYCGCQGYVLICENGHRTFVFNRCDLRICHQCSDRSGKRLWAKYTPVLRQALGWKRPGYGLKFLTLTKQNPGKTDDPEDLGRQFKKFFTDVRKLINTAFPKEKGCGALAVLEVTRNFTIHCHAVVYGPYVPQDRLADLWHEITGDSRVIDIRAVKRAAVHKSLNYILKYIFKPAQFDQPRDYAVYLAALRGVRRIHTYGIFYNYTVEEQEAPPVVCPHCGGSLAFDKAFYLDYGVLSVSILRYTLGIEPLVA